MRFSFLTAALAAVAGVVQAQSSTSASSGSITVLGTATLPTPLNSNAYYLCASYGLDIPPCGTSILVSLASVYGNCSGLVDFQCQCAISAKIQPLASSPLIAQCGLQTALDVQGAADTLCSCIAANNEPVGVSSAPASATGGAMRGVDRANPTGIVGAFMSLGGALAIGAGFVAAL